MDAHTADLLGAWALGVCDDVAAARVEAHLGLCPECTQEARRLRAAAACLGIEQVMNPPTTLRKSVLDRARQLRPPSVLRTLVGAYARQVAALDRTLQDLAQAGLSRPDPRHGDLAGLIRHLSENDAMLAADLGLPVIELASPVRAWRAQADSLIRGLNEPARLDREVRLAGRDGPVQGTLQDALVQRAFETWIHHEDVRGAATSLSPEQAHRIASLAVGLLPTAVAAQGISVPGESVLILGGEGGGRWTVPFGDFTIRADAVGFARLAAGRITPVQLRCTVEGDRRLAERVLQIAATLGCD